MRASDGIVYALMVLPTLFVVAIIGQGYTKLKNGDDSGKVGIGFGVFLFILVIAAYILFIR